MILVDTSVWIRFLANREPWSSRLDALLSRDKAVGHELVFGELLIGDKGGRKKLLETYEQMHQAPTIPHQEVVAFVKERHLFGRGAGWIDIHLLASAMVGHHKLWTADPRLGLLAEQLAVAYSVDHP